MSSMRKRNNAIILLVVLILVSLILRVPNLGFPFFGDEAWHDFVKFHKGNLFSLKYTSIDGEDTIPIDPPLTGWFYLLYSLIFGFSTIILRSTSLLFALINIFLVYTIAKKVFDRKTALFSTFLLAISYWHCIESYILDRDGNFLIFFYLVILLLYLYYRETKNKRYLWLGALISIPYMFIKISGVLITAILFISILYDNKIFQFLFKNVRNLLNIEIYRKSNFKIAFFEISPFILANILSYLIFIGGTFLLSPEYFSALLTQEAIPIEFFTASWIKSIAREIIYLFLYGSPLLIGLSILSIIHFHKKKVLFLFWLFVPILAYSKIPYAGALERYLSVILPPLCILGGAFLAKLNLRKKQYWLLGGVLFFSFLLLNIFSLFKAEYLQHNINEYFLRAATLKWHFLFPFYGAGGPAFLVPFWVVAISVLLSMLFLVFAIFFLKHKKIFFIFLTLFLAVSLSFNLYILQEFNFSIHSPNIRAGFNDLLQELNTESTDKIYTNIGSIRVYTDRDIQFIRLWCPKDDYSCWSELDSKIKTTGGAAYILDFPRTFESSMRSTIIEKNCQLRKEISDKQARIGMIYDC